LLTGKFITFEGGEGGGKSTQSKLLVEALQKAGGPVVHTREPGGTPGAEAIRQLLVSGEVDKWDPLTEALLHLAARRDHVTKLIMPALEAGKNIICDRFFDSTMVYQGYGHNLGAPVIEELQKIVIGTFKPDLTIILDISTDSGISRAETRGGLENRYEKMGKEFHEKVRQGFKKIAAGDPSRCILIDANNRIENIHAQIIEAVNARLNFDL
jgi:dTMP kinase